MQALRLTSNQVEKKILESNCHLLLDQAERLRNGDESSTSKEPCDGAPLAKANHTRLKSPISTRQLTTREQIILLEGSKLHGMIFPPWKSAPKPSEFDLQDGDPQYTYVETLVF